jgi:hypothetical protein
MYCLATVPKPIGSRDPLKNISQNKPFISFQLIMSGILSQQGKGNISTAFNHYIDDLQVHCLLYVNRIIYNKRE